ncbi:hypothetical protein EYF80_060756 [Liparis tanakae]|uniref:Uncharacterized protein n=1 Tax=Liparis tanakae TaxID=230148 RepID=A0A4Z2EJH8_9TELE|nr:hypothetical protein EYF80_060756 [Liparis tanakae]
MESLTEGEIAQIARQQEFVYAAAMFSAARGFPWPAVIRATAVGKVVFPQLGGPGVPGLVSLLRDALSAECLLNLLQAAVGGAADVSTTQLRLEVQLPPTPCPLAEVKKPLQRSTTHKNIYFKLSGESEPRCSHILQ